MHVELTENELRALIRERSRQLAAGIYSSAIAETVTNHDILAATERLFGLAQALVGKAYE